MTLNYSSPRSSALLAVRDIVPGEPIITRPRHADTTIWENLGYPGELGALARRRPCTCKITVGYPAVRLGNSLAAERLQVLAAGVRIERFDAATDDARLRACYEIVAGAQQEDDPNGPPASFGRFRGWWIYGQAGVPQQTWLATTDSGTPVGCYVLELPERENQGSAFCYLVVAQAARRRGVGTALVAHIAGQAELASTTSRHSTPPGTST